MLVVSRESSETRARRTPVIAQLPAVAHGPEPGGGAIVAQRLVRITATAGATGATVAASSSGELLDGTPSGGNVKITLHHDARISQGTRLRACRFATRQARAPSLS